MRDDLLGAFGDPAVTGKPAGDDLRSGKPTALLLLARQLRPDISDISGEAIAATGAPEAVEAMIRQRVAAAVAGLAAAPIAAEARAALSELAVRATQRPCDS